jgi:hypothetical protein
MAEKVLDMHLLAWAHLTAAVPRVTLSHSSLYFVNTAVSAAMRLSGDTAPSASALLSH